MKVDCNKLYFTSDTHFYHDGIREYIDRPFSCVEEMNESLIKNWNAIVEPDANIFVLGDFAFTSNINTIYELTKKLNGNIHLILGNHDHQNRFDREEVRRIFASTHDLLDLKVIDPEMESGVQRLFLCHYPMISWAGSIAGSWNLFGHLHTKPYRYSEQYNPRTMDVGVDAHDYFPITYRTVKRLITQQCLTKQNNNG